MFNAMIYYFALLVILAIILNIQNKVIGHVVSKNKQKICIHFNSIKLNFDLNIPM